MNGRITGLYRHPIKGFTPEPLTSAALAPGQSFPCDRLYAVENGPSGFDPAAPKHISKQKFVVLAVVPGLARVRTRFDETDNSLTAEAPGLPAFHGRMDQDDGRERFAAWLDPLLSEDERRGPLKVVGTGVHRFTDNPAGHVSILNLASVRDLEARTGRRIDPLRFRANVHVEGWEPWVEAGMVGAGMTLGDVRARVFKTIVRCAATHVDPDVGVRDMELTADLFENYGHMNCGVYVHVERAGTLAIGDACDFVPEAP